MTVIRLAPSEIRFSQDSISNSFGDSTNHADKYIGGTLDEIVRDPHTADLIPNISVFKMGGKWVTSDNKRLWVFKKAEELGILSSIEVSVTYGIDYSKLTRSGGGRYVRIHWNNPGGHLWRSLQRKNEEQKIKEQREREQQMEIERQRRIMEQRWERERQRREREQQMEIERQQRVRTQMEKDRRLRVIIKISWMIAVVIVVLSFLYWAIIR